MSTDSMKTAVGFKKGYIFFILLLVAAAVFKSLNAPFSSLLLQDAGPMTTMSLMSFGAIIFGFFVVFFSRKELKTNPVRRLHKKDTPSLLLIILVDLAGNILFLIGLSMCLASTASLLKCFGLVATTVIAFFLLKERISRRLFIAILLITLGCITISVGDMGTIAVSPGVLLVLASCITSGFSYTLRKKIADRNPGLVLLTCNGSEVIIGVILAFILGEGIPDVSVIVCGILLGLVVFGIPSALYQVSARKLGASKCTSVLNFAPFIGAGISFILFQQMPTLAFFVSFFLLIPGFYLVVIDKNEKKLLDGSAEQPPPLEQHYDIRNYLTAFGLLSVFVVVFITIIENLQYLLTGSYGEGLTFATTLGIAITQVVTGCALIILRRRDLTASILLMFGFSAIAMLLCGDDSYFIIGILGILMIILSVVLLLAKEKKKYCFSLLFVSIWASYLIYFLVNNSTVQIILSTAILVYLFLLVAGASGLLPQFPLTKVLAEDESLSFEKTGPFLCYIIIAVSVLPWMGIYLLGTELVPLASVGTFSIGCAVMLGILSLLLIFVGKDRFLAAAFLGVMLFLLLAGSTSYLSHYIAGIVMFLTGLFCLLRKKSYLLPGLMCILYGISSFTTMVIHGGTMLLISQFIMQGLTFLLAVYLAVAVFSRNRRLPVF